MEYTSNIGDASTVRLDIAEINRVALFRLESLCYEWFPAGKKEGHEFKVGSLAGEKGTSLCINLTKGVWKDFASGEGGSDPVSLLAAKRTCSQIDAARELSQIVGSATYTTPSKGDEWEPIMPIPNGTPHPTFSHWKHGKPGAKWTYGNENGDSLGYMCRFDKSEGKKEIIPLVWAKCGDRREWRWLSFPKPRPLFNLAHLSEYPGAKVLIVEGEKTADAANALLLGHADEWIALSWPGGCKAVSYANWKPLQGRTVYLWPDNDGPGREAVAAIVAQLGAGTVITPPANTSTGWDLADALAEGWDGDRLLTYLHTPENQEKMTVDQNEPPQKTASLSFTDNDAGRAQYFCERWKHEIAFVPDRGIWLCWENGRWAENKTGGLHRRAIAISGELLAKAAALPCNSDASLKERKAAIANGMEWGDKRTIDPMLALAETVLSVQVPVAKLDADPFLVGAKNGVIDLRTGKHRPYTQADYITQALGTDFDPLATCPRWEQFMVEIFPDPDVREYLKKSAGYSLTADMREQCFFFLHGLGCNGKSTFLKIIEAVFGDYATRGGKALVAANERGGYPLREAAKIVGKRLVLASETVEKERLNIGVIKDISGGDSMDAANLYENAFTFKPVCKIWFAGNHKPSIPDTSMGAWRRVRLIPFDQQFTGDRKDASLETKLIAELPGILKWLVSGCMSWQQHGMKTPAAVASAVESYRTEEDTLGEFIEQCISEEQGATTPHSDVFAAYQRWSTGEGIKYPLAKIGLSKRLQERGWHRGPRVGTSFTNWSNVTVL